MYNHANQTYVTNTTRADVPSESKKQATAMYILESVQDCAAKN